MVLSSSWMWWFGIFVVFALLVAYLLWSARQLLAEEELDLLTATLNGLKRKAASWQTGFMDGLIAKKPSVNDLVTELRMQLSKTRTIEDGRWTKIQDEMQNMNEHIRSIESRLSSVEKSSS